jgi:TolB-like protein
MSDPQSSLSRLMAELKRRHVLRVAAGYAAVAFATVSIASDFLPALHLPEWSVTLVAALVLLGFPIAIVLAWAFEITPDGVRRTADAPDAPGAPPRRSSWRPATATGYLGVGIIVGMVGIGAYARFNPNEGSAGAGRDGERITALAVLPFENMTEDPANEYMSDGITEEITTQLFKVAGLHVKSRTSTLMYRGGMKTVEQVGTELGVGAVIEGSFRRMGDQIRVVARLVDTRNGQQLWAEDYDRGVGDLMRVQVEIAEQITAALRTTLTSDEKRRFASDHRRTTAPEAIEEYYRGLSEYGAGRLVEAIAAYQRAIAHDPAFAPAYAAMARSYYFLGFFGALPPTDVFARMRDAAAKAVELDPDIADAHATLGLYYLHYKWDWARSEQQFRRALELSPNAAQVRHDYAHFLLATGRTAESVEQSNMAAELDPGNTMLMACAGWHGFTDREYDGAVRSSMSALMMMPGMFWPEIVLGWAYEQKGQYPEAIASLRSAVAHSEAMPFAVASLAHALGASGQQAAARQLLGGLLDKADERYVSAYDVAIIYAGLGDAKSTFDWLRRAYAERSAFLVNIGWEPRFDALRDDPRFTAIVSNLRLPPRPVPAAPRAVS